MILAKVVMVSTLSPSGLLKKDIHRGATTFDVTGQGALILFEGQNAKTSKMPVAAYSDGHWDSVNIEEEPA